MNLKQQIKLDGDIIGLDIGSARTGVARVSTTAKITEPLAPVIEKITPILGKAVQLLEQDYRPCAFVVGLPRGLDGQDTEQTRVVRAVFDDLRSNFVDSVPFFLIDEAGTTKEAELRAKKGESVDSVAACIILETFIAEVERGNIKDVTF